METRIDDDMLETWRGFLLAHARVVARLEAELEAERGLALSWYDVLTQLRYAPEERLRLQALGDRLHLTKSGLSRRVDRMEAAGLVVREECEEDKRGVLIALTPEGARIQLEAQVTHRRGIAEHFLRHVSAEDAAVLRRVFVRVLETDEAAIGSRP